MSTAKHCVIVCHLAECSLSWAVLGHYFFLSAIEMAALALLVLLVTTILHYRLLNVMKIMWV